MPVESARRAAAGLLLLLGAASVGLACWSLVDGGIGWDSRLDTAAAAAIRHVHSSWPLAQAYEYVPLTSEFYGAFLQQFGDVLHLLTSGHMKILSENDPSTYLYQGAANLILSVGAVTALAVAIGVAFRSLLAGAFVWSVTLATPLWLGMSHVDFKDVPVASGLTLVTAGLMLSFSLRGALKATVVGVLLAGWGGGFVLATRAGALVLLVGLAGGTAVVVLAWSVAQQKVRATLPMLISCGAALAGAFIFTWATNPIARIDMWQWLQDSIDVAHNFPYTGGPIRMLGRDVQSSHLPWWYVPAWLGAQLPLLTIVAVVGGVGLVAFALVRRRASIRAETAIPLVPLLLQAIFIPVGVVLSRPVLYDGIRHLLFMIPGLMAVAAVGLALADRRVAGSVSRRAAVLPLGAVVVVAASLYGAIRWAPYSYAYINPIAGIHENHRDWDLDFWGVSGKEGVRRLQKLGYSPIHVEPTAMVGIPFGGAYGPTTTVGRRTGLYVFLRWSLPSDFGCQVIFTITRDGHVLGEGARCPPNPGA